MCITSDPILQILKVIVSPFCYYKDVTKITGMKPQLLTLSSPECFQLQSKS